MVMVLVACSFLTTLSISCATAGDRPATANAAASALIMFRCMGCSFVGRCGMSSGREARNRSSIGAVADPREALQLGGGQPLEAEIGQQVVVVCEVSSVRRREER